MLDKSQSKSTKVRQSNFQRPFLFDALSGRNEKKSAPFPSLPPPSLAFKFLLAGSQSKKKGPNRGFPRLRFRLTLPICLQLALYGVQKSSNYFLADPEGAPLTRHLLLVLSSVPLCSQRFPPHVAQLAGCKGVKHFLSRFFGLGEEGGGLGYPKSM